MLKKRPNRIKCIICQKRYVSQQIWKTAREKEVCTICLSIESFIKSVYSSIKILAEEKGLKFEFKFSLKPITKGGGQK